MAEHCQSGPHRPLSAVLPWAAFVTVLATSGITWAGPPIGAGPTGGPGGPTNAGGPKDKEDGPAEAAPKDKEALRPIEAVPAQPRGRREVQFFEAHGYFRMRADYFHRLDLGLAPRVFNPDSPGGYFRPPAESDTPGEGDNPNDPNNANCRTRLLTNGATTSRIANRCNRRRGVASANLRLRVSPIFHVSDTVRVKTTIDVLDNLVLGSTPDVGSFSSQWAGFSTSQVSPEDFDSVQDAISVKEAYGEVEFGWGLRVRAGRSFSHWGLGIVYNDGNGYDRLERGDIVRQLDQDYGDSLDSIELSYAFGKDPRQSHRLSLEYTWAASGPTASTLGVGNVDLRGQDFSAEKFDNVHQVAIAIERRDKPSLLRRKLTLGNPVLNYGLKTWLRFQDVDQTFFLEDQTPTFQEYADALVHRRLFMATPDIWWRVNWRTLRFEMEAAANLGYLYQTPNTALESLDSFNDIGPDQMERRAIANFGYALEFKYGLFQDRFHIGFDQGYATGDDRPSEDFTGTSPFSDASSGSQALANTFRFNPAYTQDLLLFRQVLGTPANAAYFRPWAAFYFFQNFVSARADIQYALASQRSATIGNRFSYGLEFDASFRYHDPREPIFFQFQYGVLFPFGAFNPTSGFEGSNEIRSVVATDDAKAAQSVQAQFGIKF